MRPLPPYGRAIVAMLERRERPRLLGGAFSVALAWDLAPSWPRIIIADDPSRYRLDFARGLDWLILARDGHPEEHVAAVVAALRQAGAHIVAPPVILDESSV